MKRVHSIPAPVRRERGTQSQEHLSTFLSFVCGILLRRLLGEYRKRPLRRKQRFC